MYSAHELSNRHLLPSYSHLFFEMRLVLKLFLCVALSDARPVISIRNDIGCADATLRKGDFRCGDNETMAMAYDHHDGKILLTETIYQALPIENKLPADDTIDYDTRAKYFVRKYYNPIFILGLI
jgi:hypothetical protein